MKTVLLDGTHDPREFRNALGRFPTGVTVITTRTPAGKIEGLTANSFSALSLDPPMVLWSISRKSGSVQGFVDSGYFTIHVLRAAQANISHRFATPSANKFADMQLDAGFGDTPLLPDVLATFECKVESTIDGGDHLLFVGRVHRISYGEGDPLIFSAGKYCTALPMRDPSAKSDIDGIWEGLG